MVGTFGKIIHYSRKVLHHGYLKEYSDTDFFSKFNPLHDLLERGLLSEGSQVLSERKKI